LIGILRKEEAHAALVFDGEKYLGVIGKRFLLTSRIDPGNMRVANILKHRSKSKSSFFVPELSEDTDLKEICRLMANADTHVLPVIKNKKVIGVVHAKDVALAIAGEYRGIACDRLGTMGAITVKRKDEIGKALEQLKKRGIDHLPVVDENNELAGVLATSDLLESPGWVGTGQHISKAASHQKGKRTGYGSAGQMTRMLNLPVENCMSRGKMCCTEPGNTIPNAVQMMAEDEVCDIILCKKNKPVGILTLKDIFLDYIKA
jgi:predicted transcriptional regulator